MVLENQSPVVVVDNFPKIVQVSAKFVIKGNSALAFINNIVSLQ